jgi:hypothetical protein
MRLDPQKEIPPTGQTVGDFWAWGFSDVLSNINRAVLAEWLVGSALDCVGGIRPIWAPWDLDYKGSKIEVKSTSNHQNWKRSPNSPGTFDIKATTADFPVDPAIPVGPEAEYYTDPEVKRRAEVEAQRRELEGALREAQGRQETIRKLQSEREMVFRRFAAMRGIDLRCAGPEDRRRVLQALGVRAEVDKNGDVRISGVFDADITELLPMVHAPADELYSRRFRYEIPPPFQGVVALTSTP